MRQTPEITALARRGADLTRQIESADARRARLARERAQVWRAAVAAGATHDQLARRARVHKAQVHKALDRYDTP